MYHITPQTVRYSCRTLQGPLVCYCSDGNKEMRRVGLCSPVASRLLSDTHFPSGQHLNWDLWWVLLRAIIIPGKKSQSLIVKVSPGFTSSVHLNFL